MQVLWQAPQAMTAQDIHEALAGEVSWSPRTVKTLLGRLVKKEAVGFEPQGRRYLYSALVSQESCVQRQTRSFLDRVFGGALAPMVANLVDQGEVADEDLEALRRMLNERAGEDQGD